MKEYGIPCVAVRLVSEGQICDNAVITSVESAAEALAEHFAYMDRECFAVMCLRTDGSIINFSIVSIGSIDKSIASPSDVFKVALLSNTHHIIVMHNHPSGNVHPSDYDDVVTKNLVECGKILGIPVVDHIIFSGMNKMKYFSYRKNERM